MTVAESAKTAKSKEYKALREGLINIVKDLGGSAVVFNDLIDDYMTFWLTKELLKADIRENGVKSMYSNGATQQGERVNPSIDKLRQVNAQMIKILDYLGISIETVAQLVPDEL